MKEKLLNKKKQAIDSSYQEELDIVTRAEKEVSEAVLSEKEKQIKEIEDFTMLHPGLYEQVINNALTGELAEIPEARKSVAPIDKAEASKVLAQYLADVVQKGLDNVLDNGGDISAQIGLTNQIVDLIQNTTKEADFAALGVDRRAEQLLALLRETDPRWQWEKRRRT